MRVGSALWRRLAYAGARYGPTPWVRYSPAVFGVLFAGALPEARRSIRRNQRRVLGARPPWQEKLDVVRTFVAYAHCLAESLGADRAEAKSSQVSVSGKQHLEAALANGQGAVLVTAHSGAWDTGARLLTRDLHRPVMIVMSSEQDARARELHDSVRHRSGIQTWHVGRHPASALPLLGHVRRGGILALQLDRFLPGTASVPVRIFGGEHRVPRGPFQLARTASAPVIPAFCRRRGYFDYEIRISEPIWIPRSNSATELQRAAQRAASDMERFILDYPTQWFDFTGTLG